MRIRKESKKHDSRKDVIARISSEASGSKSRRTLAQARQIADEAVAEPAADDDDEESTDSTESSASSAKKNPKKNKKKTTKKDAEQKKADKAGEKQVFMLASSCLHVASLTNHPPARQSQA